MMQPFDSQVFTQEKLKYVHRKTSTWKFLVSFFPIAKPGNTQYPSTDNWVNKCGMSIQWNNAHQYKGVTCWHTQECGWISKSSHWVKEARNKRIYIVWCHLFKVLENTSESFLHIQKHNGCLEPGWREEWTVKGKEGHFWGYIFIMVKVLTAYTTVRTYQIIYFNWMQFK